MKRVEVDSSMIAAVGYDAASGEMEAVFHNGQVWRYQEVPEETYTELLAADSKGRYMRHAVIGIYPEYRVSRRRRG